MRPRIGLTVDPEQDGARPDDVGPSRKRTPAGVRLLVVACMVVLLGVVAAAGVSVASDDATPLSRFVPDVVAYRSHLLMAQALNDVGLAPSKAAMQWVRAASHAPPTQISSVVQGIVATRRQSGFAWEIDDELCTAYVHGSDSVRLAISGAGLSCSGDPGVFTHVPEGTPVSYDTNPPVGGPHYPVWYPTYGVALTSVEPGYWVHNLEHGAVVLLYRCDGVCSATRAELSRLYADLPPAGHNERLTGPRLLITEYPNMDHPYAVIAWGHRLELDTLDLQQIDGFYERFVDRGPECRNLVCPT